MLLELRKAKAQMEKYLDLRRQMEDWHGVMDAAADIREIEAQIKVIEELHVTLKELRP